MSMRHITRLIVLAALAATAASCGNARDGRSPVFLGIDSLTGIDASGTSNSPLTSDIQRDVTSPAPCTDPSPCPVVFNNLGQAALRIVLKDVTNPSGPTSNNDVTINSYRVSYRRSNTSNREGVDVPASFTRGVTATISGNSATTVGFELVRTVAKQQSPLVQLLTSNEVITMQADVTFFGKDRAGNDISVTGTIQIDFGSFRG
jgi:hypothetical protein